MKLKMTFTVVAAALLSLSACAAEGPWQGKQAAVALTYDDALNVHLDTVVPVLDEHGMRGTFYVTASSGPFNERVEDWRSAAKTGHELGNHTLFHPCIGQRPGREWVAAERDLSSWTPQRMIENLEVHNTLLQAIDGKTERSFAYPCGDMEAGGESYVHGVKDLFPAARGVQSGIQQPQQINVYDIQSYMIMGQSGEELKALVDEALEKQGLVVFLFHGVGGEHNLNVSLEAHNELVAYLQAKRENLWIAPMLDIAQYVSEQQAQSH